jgi:beta-lactamase class A
MLIENKYLQKQFELFDKNCSGMLGVHATHIETQKQIGFNSDKHFMMCSTYKMPIAICFLQAIENKKFHLQDLIEVKKSDICPGVNSTINQLNFDLANAKISLHNLLLMMLQESDNTSTDIILRLVGGPEAVMKTLRAAQINELRVDRYFYDILCAWDGLKHSPDIRPTLSEYKYLEDQVNKIELEKIRKNFLNDKKDSTTPRATTDLLIKLFKKELLNETHTQLLITIMRGCKRGQLRLMGLLPLGTPIAHKTGTVTGHVSNIGIITLPHQRGHVAISAFIKEATKELTASERILAEVGRTVYDYFLFSD